MRLRLVPKNEFQPLFRCSTGTVCICVHWRAGESTLSGNSLIDKDEEELAAKAEVRFWCPCAAGT